MRRFKTTALCTLALLGAVAWFFWLQHKHILRLEAENQDLRVHSSQTEALIQENQRLFQNSNTEAERPLAAPQELLRLRGQVSLLQRATRENAQLKTEVDKLAQDAKQAEAQRIDQLLPKDPELRLGTIKTLLAGLWGNAVLKYAKANDGHLPDMFAAAAPYLLDEPMTAQAATTAGISIDDFELVYHGSLHGIEDPSKIVLIRERQPVHTSNGRWSRVYVYGDGETSTHCSDDREFTEVEGGKAR
jgi:hypothetical protein